MQTQTEIESSPSVEKLGRQIEAAQAELAKLQTAADDADAEAKRWVATFDREPTEQAALAKMVAERKAINARAAAEAHEREVLQALVEAQRREERQAAGADLERERRNVEAKFNEATESFMESVRSLDAAVNALAAHHGSRMRASQGGVSMGRLSLAQIVDAMNDRFSTIRAAHAHGQLHTNARAAFVHGGSDTRVTLEFSRPAQAVPTPLW